MQPLIDTMLFTAKSITSLNESTANGSESFLYMEGPIQAADTINGNGRVYPMNILQEKIDKYINEFIKTKTSYGELDHPSYNEVKLKYSSHILTDIWWIGKDVYGKFKILNTPNGQILKQIIEGGGSVGVSSRALGDVKREIWEGGNTVEMVTDLDIKCWDFVSNPSTFNAYVKAINESKNNNISNYTKNLNQDLNFALTNIINTLS